MSRWETTRRGVDALLRDNKQLVIYLDRRPAAKQKESRENDVADFIFFFLTFNDTTIRTHRTKAHRSHYLKKNK